MFFYYASTRQGTGEKKCKKTKEKKNVVFALDLGERKTEKKSLPSHAVSQDSVDLTVVGEKSANVLLRCRRFETCQIAETGYGVFVGFDKVNADISF